jgi:hypothetical protein
VDGLAVCAMMESIEPGFMTATEAGREAGTVKNEAKTIIQRAG